MGQTASRDLVTLGERVGAWRKGGGGRGSHIPDELWDEAVRVARVEGLYATSRVTHFNYRRLQVRLEQTKKDERVRIAGPRRELPPDSPAFVAMQVAPPRTECTQTAIELVGRHGDRMRLDVNGSVDVLGLVQAFWSRQP